MKLDSHSVQMLAQQLPVLTFDPQQDCAWARGSLAQTYLNYYGINFAEAFTHLEHGFGCINAAGFRIATHYWLPANPQGTLIVVHGYYDHVGIFAHPIRFALENNLAVLAFDLPGHGLSSGKPAEIDSFNQYGDVLAELLQQSAAIMPQPLYALGQSTGCAVLLNYVWRYAHERNALEQFTKMALCSPLVLPRGWRGMGQYTYAVLRHFIRRIGRSFSKSSHDLAFCEFLQNHDPLQAQVLPLCWIGAMKQWHEMLLAFAPLPVSVLIVQGTGDMTVDWKYNTPLLQQKLPQAKVVYITDAGHQLVNESDVYRQQVFSPLQTYFFGK